jgi:aminopeptidase N
MIAFPDFSSGGMEHWGLIGYRETSLLYSDETNSVANKQSVAFVVSHELAHFVIYNFYDYYLNL